MDDTSALTFFCVPMEGGSSGMCFSLRTMIVSFILQAFVGWRGRGNRLFMKQPTADRSGTAQKRQGAWRSPPGAEWPFSHWWLARNYSYENERKSYIFFKAWSSLISTVSQWSWKVMAQIKQLRLYFIYFIYEYAFLYFIVSENCPTECSNWVWKPLIEFNKET